MAVLLIFFPSKTTYFAFVAQSEKEGWNVEKLHCYKLTKCTLSYLVVWIRDFVEHIKIVETGNLCDLPTKLK